MTMQDVDHQLFTDSVYEELAIMDSQAGEKRIEELLNHLDLLGYKDRHSMTLSGGQKQRLVLAAASLSGREIMLFDEPASGLDYKNMCRVCQLIREISRHKIVFAATHDRELITLLCTKELRMENGTSRFLNLIKS